MVEADLVLFATGYDSEKKLKSLLPKIFAEPIEKSAVVPLYRLVIHYSSGLFNVFLFIVIVNSSASEVKMLVTDEGLTPNTKLLFY